MTNVKEGREPLGREVWLTVVAMSIASGMVWLAISDVAIVLPTIQREFDASFSELQWINGVSFTITLTALVIIGGRLADTHGRRKVMWWGLGIFAAASALCGLFSEPVPVIIGRGLQGVGGALILPTSLAIIVAVVPAGRRGLPIGVWGAVTALLQGAAPAIAGAFEAVGFWQLVFWINLPLALLVFLMTRAFTAESRAPGDTQRLDLVGSATLAVTTTAICLLFIQGDEWGWTSTRSLATAATMVVAAVGFIVAELRSSAPLVRLSLFRNPLFTGSNVLILAANVAFAGVMFFLALYLQDVLGESALVAGLAFLPGAAMIAIVGPLTGGLFDNYKLRWSAVPGPLLYVAAFAAALAITTSSGYAVILVVFVLIGIGTGFVVTYTAAAVVNAAPANEAGAASGVLTTAATLGTALGTALTGALFESVAEPNFASRSADAGVDISPSLTDQLTGVLSGADSATQAMSSMSSSAMATVEAAARAAFVEGLQATMLVLGVLMLAVTVLAWATARRRWFDPSNVT